VGDVGEAEGGLLLAKPPLGVVGQTSGATVVLGLGVAREIAAVAVEVEVEAEVEAEAKAMRSCEDLEVVSEPESDSRPPKKARNSSGSIVLAPGW
jgi:hypothetical protein